MERSEGILRGMNPVGARTDRSIIVHVGLDQLDARDRVEERDKGIDGHAEEENRCGAAHGQSLTHAERGEEPALDFMAGSPAIRQVADILQDPQRGASLAKDCEEPAGVYTLKGFG